MGSCRSIQLVLVGSCALATGCTAYRPVKLDQVSAYDHVRVTTAELEKVRVLDPSLEEESLRGYLSEQDRSVGNVWDVPVDQVTEIEAKQANTVGTVALVALGVGMAAAIISVVDWNDSDTF